MASPGLHGQMTIPRRSRGYGIAWGGCSATSIVGAEQKTATDGHGDEGPLTITPPRPAGLNVYAHGPQLAGRVSRSVMPTVPTISPNSSWPSNHPARPCNPPPWCMRPTSAWVDRRRSSGPTAATSSRPQRAAMRRIRIDEARHRQRRKRGGARQRVALEEAPPVFDEDSAEILSLDEALDRLERVNKRAAVVVLLRYYGGLTTKETAKALDVSPRTVESDWSFARAWLHRELKKGDSSVGKRRNDDGH